MRGLGGRVLGWRHEPGLRLQHRRGPREGVAKAVEAVRAGEIVVLPTDTVYGVGADAFSAEAVASLLAAKGRGREMPPPVLVPSVRTVDGLATDVPAWARDLIREFWPGPLTLVFKAQSSLMWDLGETNGTVALRMPQDDIALAVLTEVGPMAVTSANLTGQPRGHHGDRRRLAARRGRDRLPRRWADHQHRGVDDPGLHRRGVRRAAGRRDHRGPDPGRARDPRTGRADRSPTAEPDELRRTATDEPDAVTADDPDGHPRGDGTRQ